MSRKVITFIVLSLLITITFWSCEEFQKEEFTISDLDAKACELLRDTLSYTITTSQLTNFDSSWVGSAVYEKVEEILNSLETNGIMVTDSDTSFTINTPEDVDSNYVSFFTESNEVVFFFGDFVDMNIIRVDGTVLDADRAISLEAVYHAVSPDTIYDCSKLKARFLYKISENKNLLQIIKTDQTMDPAFRLVILPNR